MDGETQETFLSQMITQIRAQNDLQQNRHLGISVSRCTEIVHKNVLSVSKNPLSTQNLARKLSPGLQRVPVYRNRPRQLSQRIKKRQGHTKPIYEL